MVRNNNQNQDQSLDPYYVHSSENSSTVSVTPQLNGDNYHSWSMKMRRALAMKNKYKFVDGSIPVPNEDDLNRSAWERCNNLVHTWIINSISPSIAHSVVFIEYAIDMWNDLKDRFMRGDRIRVAQLHQEIANLKQGEHKITDYFTELRGLWEELDQYRPMPQCTCPMPCTCLAMRNTKSFRAEDRIIQFLIGLNEEYQGVVSQVLLMDPMPPINRVFSLVMQQERKLQYGVVHVQNTPLEDNTGLVNAVNGQKQFGRGRGGTSYQGRGRGNDNGRFCTFCERTNHTVDTCYKKHGYPPNWGRGGGNSYANMVDAEDTESKINLGSASKHDENAGVTLTKDQYQNLMTLLEKSNLEVKCSANVVKGSNSISLFEGNSFLASFESKQKDRGWIVDTGATHHTCHDLNWFTSYSEIESIIVNLPNGSSMEACYRGQVKLSKDLSIDNVLYLPKFAVNLISVSKLCREQNCKLEFEADICIIQAKNTLRKIGLAKERHGLYYLETDEKHKVSVSNISASLESHGEHVPDGVLWHLRLGHLSHDRMICMNKMYSYVPISPHTACDVCQMCRQKILPFPISSRNAKTAFDLVHFDIWGPFNTTSVHGHKYFLTILDDCTRHTWIVMLKNKSEASCQVKSFVSMIERQFERKIKMIRSDNGPEFMLREFYDQKGIIHQRSCVYTPQQNGRVERRHQHILNISRALMFQSRLPKKFWSYAVLHAIYLINRIPTKILNNKSSYEVLYNAIPDLSCLKVFGCLSYASTLPVNRHKFDPRARKCAFLGFKPGIKGFVLVDVHTTEILVSRNVKFLDLEFPFHSSSVTHISNTQIYLNDSKPVVSHQTNQLPITSSPTDVPVSNEENNEPLEADNVIEVEEEEDEPVRRSSRISQVPSHLQDYVCNSVRCNYPIDQFLSYSALSSKHQAYAFSLNSEVEPPNFQVANQDSRWIAAMQTEIEALNANHTWEFVDLPPDAISIGSKWVYKIKRYADGTIERFKARLVAQGFSQTEGLDYFETFSPVAKLSTVRVLLALASIHGWYLHQLDVNNAFLHGDLHEAVYMKVPKGVVSPKQGQVCKLLKSLYGLKQASRQWFEKLTQFLHAQGYVQANSDHTLFTKITAISYTVILVYVDDIILAGTCLKEFDCLKQALDEAFRIKNLGELKFFLGLEVARSSKGISLCQRKYCLELLADSGLTSCKPVSTPLDPSIRLTQDNGASYADITGYRRLVGRLLYLTTTRPDIAFAAQQLSQFMASPTELHHKAALRVLRYLKRSPGRGLFFPATSDLQLLGFSDADWGGCVDTRRSISGYCFFIGKSLVSWKSKKQPTVSCSSAEAEYRALASATRELQWMCFLLHDLNQAPSRLPVLYCDNQSALHISANPVFHERTKHLDIDCHLVREKIQAGVMRLLPVTSQHQTTDVFTKASGPKQFHECIVKLGMVDIYQPPV